MYGGEESRTLSEDNDKLLFITQIIDCFYSTGCTLRFNGLHFKMDARNPNILQWIWLTINLIVNKRLDHRSSLHHDSQIINLSLYSSVPFFIWWFLYLYLAIKIRQQSFIRFGTECAFLWDRQCRTVSSFRIASAAWSDQVLWKIRAALLEGIIWSTVVACRPHHKQVWWSLVSVHFSIVPK